ncbi:MAG: hypothetical protein MAG794_00187 [Gammaproteobacteria bacterium]|nr:hypothetical protein [Gammaproteobacteria bacterium]
MQYGNVSTGSRKLSLRGHGNVAEPAGGRVDVDACRAVSLDAEFDPVRRHVLAAALGESPEVVPVDDEAVEKAATVVNQRDFHADIPALVDAVASLQREASRLAVHKNEFVSLFASVEMIGQIQRHVPLDLCLSEHVRTPCLGNAEYPHERTSITYRQWPRDAVVIHLAGLYR